MNSIEQYINEWLADYDRFFVSLGVANVYFVTAIKVVATLFIALLAWLVLKILLASFEKRTDKFDFFHHNVRFFRALRKAASYAVMLVAGLYLIRMLGIPIFDKIYFAFFIVLFAGPAQEALLTAIRFMKTRLNRQDTKLDDILFDLLTRFSGFIIYAIAIIMAMDKLGINVMPFIAGAGVAGVAIGFAAKDTLSNLIAGVLLIIDRPFEIGDRIEVWSAPKGSATWGDVVDIGLRATRIKTTDNIVIIIPNNEVMLRDIINYTAINSKIRVRVNIGISYEADLKKAKSLIIEVAESMPWASADPKPVVVVNNFGDSSVDLQLRVWIDNARKRIHTISYVTDQVKEVFDREGIEIPYPKRDINITYGAGNDPTQIQNSEVEKKGTAN